MLYNMPQMLIAQYLNIYGKVYTDITINPLLLIYKSILWTQSKVIVFKASSFTSQYKL